MKDYYTNLHESNDPIAWCSSVGPAELLIAMGFNVFFPENHAAIIATYRKAKNHVSQAHAAGFSRDACGYLRADIGASLDQYSPLTAFHPKMTAPPAPNVLIYSTNQCRDIKEWFLYYAEKLHVPCIGIESPTNIGDISPDILEVVTKQMKAMVPKLEQIAHKKLNTDRLERVISNSKACSNLWRNILETARSHPSPLLFDTALTLMGPAVVMRGTHQAVDAYKRVLDELNEWQRAGLGAQKSEAYRVYFDGMPIWGKVREIDRIQKPIGIATVASTYCSSWIFSALDPLNPLESMAQAYTELFIVRSEKTKLAYIKQMAKRFKIDGIVFHEAKTCPSNSNTRYGMPKKLGNELNIPTLVLHGDHVDETLFDSARFAIQIEAFAEQMDSSK